MTTGSVLHYPQPPLKALTETLANLYGMWMTLPYLSWYELRTSVTELKTVCQGNGEWSMVAYTSIVPNIYRWTHVIDSIGPPMTDSIRHHNVPNGMHVFPYPIYEYEEIKQWI